MCIPITQELTGTSTDEFEIQLEDAIPPERAANASANASANATTNARTPREVLVIVPDGVAYALDRHSHPGALSLRIFVEGER